MIRTRTPVTAVLTLLAVAACGSSDNVTALDGSPPPAQIPPATAKARAGDPTTWTKVAPWPYRPWVMKVSTWTGREVLVFGSGPGQDQRVEKNRMGSISGAYNPASDTWRQIAVAPFDVTNAGVVGTAGAAFAVTGRMVDRVWTPELWAYSVDADSWRRLPSPAEDFYGVTLAGRTLATTSFGQAGRTIHLLDLDSENWRAAPADPWPNGQNEMVGLADGRIVVLSTTAPPPPTPPPGAGDSGTFVVAEPAEPRGPDNPGPCWKAAVLDTGADSWRELPRSGLARNFHGSWTAVGSRLINVETGSLPADSVEAGCSDEPNVPSGGVLDVDAGRWEPLTPFPRKAAPIFAGALGDESTAITQASDSEEAVWRYDTHARTWAALPPIPGRTHGFSDSLWAWAGDRLLIFANGALKPTKNGWDTRTVAVHDGWSWAPGERS